MAEKTVKANGKAPSSKGAEAMPLFYKKPVPLDAKAHGSLALKNDFGLDFTKDVNAVPINLIEFPQICHFYPIAFSPDENATPVALMGLRDNENLFVNDKGEWIAETYIPAYIRRYPFIFSEIPGTDQLTLCVDSDESIVETGGEQRFFDNEGKPTELANNALEFCKSYHAAAQQTVKFGKALHESDILVERAAEISIAGDKKINFSGFRIIDEQKLNALPDEKFIEFRKQGWLPFLYAHLFSGAQWQRLTKLLNDRMR